MPRKSPVGAASQIQPLNLGGMGGALQIPSVRKPTRGAAVPRGAKTKLPPGLAASASSSKTAPKKKSTSTRKRKAA